MVWGVLEKIPDNCFYNMANRWVQIAQDAQEEKEYFNSWGISTAARLPYLVDAVVDIAVGIFAAFGTALGAVAAISGKSSLLSSSGGKFVEKIDHFCVSLFGVVISPYLAHKGRDVSLVYAAGRLITFQWLYN